MKPYLSQNCRKQTVARVPHRKVISLLLVLLLAILFGLETFSWVIMEAHRILPDLVITFQNHLPALGFLGVLASSAVCWCLKHLAVHRVRREPGCVRILLANGVQINCSNASSRNPSVLCTPYPVLPHFPPYSASRPSRMLMLVAVSFHENQAGLLLPATSPRTLMSVMIPLGNEASQSS